MSALVPDAPFPALRIRASGFSAQGSFAENQARYLDPDPERVARLRAGLEARRAGVVAHYYMDAELQGVLGACDWPHIHISDSLLMADAAVEMARAGAQEVYVLGVDFMAENVRAMLDAAGFDAIPVYRAAEAEIGCSLAASAESRAYAAFLEQAARVPKALHVVYINTSLRTKAHAHARVPTITCTSSNVIQTILQAAAQEPELSIFFGPDTYMGHNLRRSFERYAGLDEASVREIHPAHDPASIARLLARFHCFEQGNCVVHHMFGGQVVERVRRDYQDAYITAHLEVPGEMFGLALAAQAGGRGVVGSTADILRFVRERSEAALAEASAETRGPTRVSFVLGTEASMVSAIANAIRETLARVGAGEDFEVEIVFPVADEAVSVEAAADSPFALLPGVSGGEGCSTAGGCASCPYMKMNQLDGLLDLLERAVPSDDLSAYYPRTYDERIAGRTVAELGSEPILHMRHFQRAGELSAELLADLRTRVA